MLSLLLSNAVFASNDRLEIQLVNNNEIDVDPGSSFCVAVMLSNYTRFEKKFRIKVNAPEGWNQIMDNSTIIVSAATKKLEIFSFYVPANTYVGDYKINIEADDNSNNTIIGRVVAPVYVKPKYGILTKTLNTPDFVFAGDTLSVRFLLENTSNVRTTLKTTIENNKVSETRNITLPPKTGQTLRVFIATDKEALAISTHRVRLTAAILGAPKINSTSLCSFKVIPTKRVKFDKYNRIPVKVSGIFATNNPNGVKNYGYMFNIQGGGALAPGEDKRLYFHFRGPNRQGSPILGQTDLYTVRYSTAHSNIVAGDHNFGLSPLTELSRRGRGVSYEHSSKHVSVGGYVNFPRFYPLVKRVISANCGYFSGDKFRLNFGYLNKTFAHDSAAQLVSVYGKITPFSWNDIKFEYATGSTKGKMSKAYSVDFKIHHKTFHLYGDFTRADPGFPGYVSNSEIASSGVSIALFHKLSLSANYSFFRANMALDTMYSNAPFSKSLVYSLTYSFSLNSGISLSAIQSTVEDMSTPKQFYYSAKSARLSIGSQIKRIQVKLYSSLGKTTNYLKPVGNELAVKTVLNSNFSLGYRINNHLRISGFVRYLGGQQFINSSFKNYIYGGRLGVVWRKKFKMELQYQSNYEVQEYYKNRSLINVKADYSLSKHDQIGAFLYYGLKNGQLKRTQLSATINFSHLFYVPSSKRKDVGNLHGKIINNGVDNIKGLRVTLSGNMTFTDKNGEFDFQNVKVGTHYLFVDLTNAGINAIPVKPGPYKINILPGITVNFQMALTLSCQIKGKIEVKNNKDLTNQGFVSVKKALRPLIIEVNNGKEIYRSFTNPDGTFDFTDLTPGPWRVKVYNRGIPEGYELKTNEFDVNLTPHEAKCITVIVKKVYHKIQFQQNKW